MHLEVKVHIYATVWLTYSFCSLLTPNFHLYPLEEAMHAKESVWLTHGASPNTKNRPQCVLSVYVVCLVACKRSNSCVCGYSTCWHMHISQCVCEKRPTVDLMHIFKLQYFFLSSWRNSIMKFTNFDYKIITMVPVDEPNKPKMLRNGSTER